MARIYFSYNHKDLDLVNGLASLLKGKGHQTIYDKGLPIGSSWREQLMAELQGADAVVLLWSCNTVNSQFVPAEVGVVRASQRIPLLPVIVGEGMVVPPFIQDLLAESLPDGNPDSLAKLADGLDRSIRQHLESRDLRKHGRPRVFISHRHKDVGLVRALVHCIQSYFEVDKHDIRCTSVGPYRLPAGANTAERLRNEIADAEIVLGVLTTDTLESTYVAFELGAAWGLNVWTCPLLAKGADQHHIPAPIRDLSPLFLNHESDCRQLLRDMEACTTLTRLTDPDENALADSIRALVDAAGVDPAAKNSG